MIRFKVGDKVTPVNAYRDNDIMKQFVGKTMLVLSVGDEIVCAGVPGEEDWYWHSDDLRLVSETQAEPVTEPTDPAPAAAQKPLRRGDLVMCRGVLWVVFSTGAQSDGDYWIASLTGDPETYYATICELSRVGSIRKKIKRLKAAIAKAGGAV